MVTAHSEYKAGMPVMLECFATWCPPCRAAAPHLAEMTKQNPQVFIISVSRETKQQVEALKKSMKPMSEYNLAVDLSGALEQFMSEQDVQGIPHCFLLSGDGKLVWQGHPMDPECGKKLKDLK